MLYVAILAMQDVVSYCNGSVGALRACFSVESQVFLIALIACVLAVWGHSTNFESKHELNCGFSTKMRGEKILFV